MTARVCADDGGDSSTGAVSFRLDCQRPTLSTTTSTAATRGAIPHRVPSSPPPWACSTPAKPPQQDNPLKESSIVRLIAVASPICPAALPAFPRRSIIHPSTDSALAGTWRSNFHWESFIGRQGERVYGDEMESWKSAHVQVNRGRFTVNQALNQPRAAYNQMYLAGHPAVWRRIKCPETKMEYIRDHKVHVHTSSPLRDVPNARRDVCNASTENPGSNGTDFPRDYVAPFSFCGVRPLLPRGTSARAMI
ncbi:hypothetical protein KM043_007162 [Ampulex compressa]|nr:hypothetical protein KM043_007162 [Ampulex compressa]